MDAALSVIPQQRPAGRLSPLPFERGSTDSGRIHAVRKTLNGNRAVCDAAVELNRLGGRFDRDDLDSCLTCIIEIAHRSDI
jgi:hypothetical protein